MPSLNTDPWIDGTIASREQALEAVRMRRRVSLFKRVGMVTHKSSHEFEIHRALTAEDLTAAYRLVHDVFVFQKYIVPQASGMRIRIYEALPEMATFVAKVDGEIVGVMSVVPDSNELGLPSDRAFGKELNDLRQAGRRIGEVTNLAVTEQYCKSTVLLELSRSISGHAANIRLDDLFIAVSPGHSGFFETILQFDPWGEARNYGDRHIDMVEGKRLDVNQIGERARLADTVLDEHAFLYDWFIGRNPWLQRNGAVSHKTQSSGYVDVLRQMFSTGGGLLRNCSTTQLQVLQHRWSQAVYNHIRPSAGVDRIRLNHAAL